MPCLVGRRQRLDSIVIDQSSFSIAVARSNGHLSRLRIVQRHAP